MIGILVLGWLLVFLILAMMFAVNSISLGTFSLLMLGTSVVFLFLIIRQNRKNKKSKVSPAKPEAKARISDLAGPAKSPQPAPKSLKIEATSATPAPVEPVAPAAKPEPAIPPAALEPVPEPAKPEPVPEIMAVPIEPAEQEPEEPATPEPVFSAQPEELQAPAEEAPALEPDAPKPAAAAPVSPLPAGRAVAPVSQEIGRKLEAIREQWFTACVKALAPGKKTKPNSSAATPASLQGDAEVALKALQIQELDAYLAQNKYFGAGRDFRDKLATDVFAADRESGNAYLRKIQAAAGTAEWYQPAVRELVAMISGAEPAEAGVQTLTGLFTEYLERTRLACARALGDKRTIAKLENQLASKPETKFKSGGQDKDKR